VPRASTRANNAGNPQHLVEVGLVEQIDGTMRLTDAGIERCKSLHHRVAADAQAELIVQEREKSGELNSAAA